MKLVPDFIAPMWSTTRFATTGTIGQREAAAQEPPPPAFRRCILGPEPPETSEPWAFSLTGPSLGTPRSLACLRSRASRIFALRSSLPDSLSDCAMHPPSHGVDERSSALALGLPRHRHTVGCRPTQDASLASRPGGVQVLWLRRSGSASRFRAVVRWLRSERQRASRNHMAWSGVCELQGGRAASGASG